MTSDQDLGEEVEYGEVMNQQHNRFSVAFNTNADGSNNAAVSSMVTLEERSTKKDRSAYDPALV